MMKQYNFLPLLMCFIFISTETTKTDDYCWRDYGGTVPPDALRANPLDKDRPVYIGQVLFKDKIIPGKIHDKDNKIYFEYFDVEYSTSENVKILCSHQPTKFEWTSTRNTEVLKLPTMSFIKGGFEPNCSSYIGRQINGEMNPGKVICCSGMADCYGLYTTNDGKGSLQGEFQILRYNENIENANLTIDIRNKPDRTENTKCKQVVINLYNN